MSLQKSINAIKLQAKVGSTQTIFIDSVTEGGSVGRISADAPEIDGVVHLPVSNEFHPKDWVEAEITAASNYDLLAS